MRGVWGIIACVFVWLLGLAQLSAEPFWPTSARAFSQGESWEAFVQPTESGQPYSGLFGSVREGGARFHEGLDVRNERWSDQGHALDQVYAVLPGRVVHVNRDAEKSSYGVYVVLVHDAETLTVYSLYSHLSEVEQGLDKGVYVEGGALLGQVGNTAGGYEIPLERSHLHFEIGLRLTDDFQAWYDKQDFDDANEHDIWNGMNLVGFNPLKYLGYARRYGKPDMTQYVKNVLPTDLVVRVFTEKIPDFVIRYPELLTQTVPRTGVRGWEIAFTWYGLPKRWTPLPRSGGILPSGIEIVRYEPKPMLEQTGRQMLVRQADGGVVVGAHLITTLELIFGE